MAAPVGRRGETRERVLAAAQELFAEHGVGGTSLQMIADRLGVTKAAVYHQFRTKDEIVLAVLRPALAQLEALVDRVERLDGVATRRDAVLEGLVEVVLDHRQVMASLQGDPGFGESLKGHPEVVANTERVSALLLGPEPTARRLVRGAMVGGALVAVAFDPTLVGLDREALRTELLAAARVLFDGV